MYVLVVVWHDLIFFAELLICHYFIYILFYSFIACLYRHRTGCFPLIVFLYL